MQTKYVQFKPDVEIELNLFFFVLQGTRMFRICRICLQHFDDFYYHCDGISKYFRQSRSVDFSFRAQEFANKKNPKDHFNLLISEFNLCCWLFKKPFRRLRWQTIWRKLTSAIVVLFLIHCKQTWHVLMGHIYLPFRGRHSNANLIPRWRLRLRWRWILFFVYVDLPSTSHTPPSPHFL